MCDQELYFSVEAKRKPKTEVGIVDLIKKHDHFLK